MSRPQGDILLYFSERSSKAALGALLMPGTAVQRAMDIMRPHTFILKEVCRRLHAFGMTLAARTPRPGDGTER